MLSSAEIQDRILEHLTHGPCGPYVVAEAIHEPPFRVRAELKDLKRRRLVQEQIGRDVHLFHLTASGCAYQAGHCQLRLV